ncbi:thioester reductase domain-containing protein [Anaerosporobacter sp.]|uniref:thioester reductase domain-containing protein n=1 Tax=Anaerosporobacter sp. TaxID=1872529 RepID=UPI00286F7839|nr:thioester reductase domain-containing protein [Anaerosporobacter sp.]
MNELIAKIEKKYIQNPDEIVFTLLEYSSKEGLHSNISYRELWINTLKMAHTLKRNHIKKKDKVVIISNNSMENIYSIFAAMMSEVVFTLVPIPTDKSKINRYKSVLNAYEPQAVIISNEVTRKIEENKLRELTNDEIEIIRFDDIDDNIELEAIFNEAEMEDTVYVQYSSGSTSEPKGVMISYENLMTNLDDISEMFPPSNHRLVSWVPFFHNIGLVAIIFATIYQERHTHLLKTEAFMANPSLWLRAISECRADITVAPDSAYDLCAKIIDSKLASNFDLSSLKMLANGSEMVNPQTVENFSTKFNIEKRRFVACYGLAEAVCGVSSASDKFEAYRIDYNEYKADRFQIATSACEKTKEVVSLGKIAKSINLVIVDIKNPSKEVSSKDKIGEVCIRGKAVASGYLGNVEDNKNFQQKIEGHEGLYYRTGDMGVIQEGNLFLTGRIKELIIINGHNICSADIQQVIKKNIPILQNEVICVFSLSIEKKERVVICIESDSANIDYAQISSEISKLVSDNFDVSPFEVLFVKKRSLTRTDNGKLRIHSIRRVYKANCLELIYSSRKEVCEDIILTEECADEIEEKVKRIFEHILKIKVLNTNDSFLELGGNSFDTLELVSQIESEFNNSFDVREILFNPTVKGIAEQIRDKIYDDNITARKMDLYKECILDDDIILQSEYNSSPGESKIFFLTGSTGFLGAYLIRTLIESVSNKEMKLYCHCRAKTKEEGLQRIIKNMKHFECWQDSYEKYIYPVLGELSCSHMGIEDEEYNRLINEVDCIYHNGALLNFMFPYEYLRKANVTGTKECLRFACTGKAKYFNYISSFSVYDNPSHFKTIAYEADRLESADGYFLGYSETKWVSEKLVTMAEKRGLRAAIYRPGDITGSVKEGIWDMGDLVSRVLVSCVQMKKIPNIPINIFFTPVDYVSEAIIHISLQKNAYFMAFNIVNTKIVNTDELEKIIQECGYGVERIPYGEWQRELLMSDTGRNSLKILDCLFKESEDDERSIVRRYGDLEAVFDTTNVDAFLDDTPIRCHPVDKTLLSKYFEYFEAKGYITVNVTCEQ